MVTYEQIKTIEHLSDISKMPISNLEKCEIFYTTLYLFYRKIGIGMHHTKVMISAVHEFSKDANNEDTPFIKETPDVKKYIPKWIIQGEQLFNSLKKNGKLEKIPLFKEFGSKYDA